MQNAHAIFIVALSGSGTCNAVLLLLLLLLLLIHHHRRSRLHASSFLITSERTH